MGFLSRRRLVAELGLTCPVACGMFLDWGLNLCLVRRQVDSLPLSPGKPRLPFSSCLFGCVRSQLEKAETSTVVRGLSSCGADSAAQGHMGRHYLFPEQGSNPWPLHWKTGS